MKVLFLASEVAPFSKSGGLADVAGALPRELAALGNHVRVATPRYPGVRAGEKVPSALSVDFPSEKFRGALFRQVLPVPRGRSPGTLEVWFLDQTELFDRDGYYGDSQGDFRDNPLRMAYFAQASLEGARALEFIPDVVHLNDWQCGLVPVYLPSYFPKARSVFTVHNLAYQGLYPKVWVERLGLPWSLFTLQRLEFYDQLSFMKGGLTLSDEVITVSPTYAREIQTPALGSGLDGVLRSRLPHIHGILNGIDTAAWNPQTDESLPAPYSLQDLAGKEECKRQLLARVALPFDREALLKPLFVFVGRLVDQKGVDLLEKLLPSLFASGGTAAILGSGEERHHLALRALAAKFPAQLGLSLGYDESLSHLFYSGADFLLMPSRFEPCGLAQMYALRYGTVPIVHATGGLLDTVKDISETGGVGVTFGPFSLSAFWSAAQRALWLYRDRALLSSVRRRGMAQDFSWGPAALKYQAIYQRAGLP